ncbi:MAG: biopolymer transporter ExbD [Planctomycetes bacterium]|nr:biopolymer transporter ExbD [Planctomycetota bacterium]
MFFRRICQFRNSTKAGSFNMTPIIDVVFLLIIFFLVVCQFIEAENFPVTVPDGCQFAQSDADAGVQVTTLTVMKGPERITFAVGPEEVQAQDNAGMTAVTEKLAELIDVRLRDLPPEDKVVTLRIDKDIPFAQAQYALAAVAQSTATDVQLAVLSDKLPSNGRPK